MIDSVKLQELRDFVQRFCFVDGSIGELRAGRFVFTGGKNRGSRTGLVANVPFDLDVDKVYGTVVQRVQTAIEEGTKHVYVDAYYTGDKYTVDWKGFDGDPHANTSDLPELAEVSQPLALAHAHVVTGLLDQLGKKDRQIQHMAEQHAESMALVLAHQVRAELVDENAQAATYAAVANAVAPALPDIVRAFAGGRKAGPKEPTEPGERIGWLLSGVMGRGLELVTLCMGHPDLVTDEQIEQMAQLADVSTQLHSGISSWRDEHPSASNPSQDADMDSVTEGNGTDTDEPSAEA